MDKKKILWVDDDEDLVLAFKERLINEGWDAQTAFSPKQAKEMLIDYTPDVIIMDVIMDEQHGYSAIEDIREYPKLADTPIIVFSSVSQKWSETTATREDALLSDVAEFVHKSSMPDELIRTIHKYLDN